MSANLTGLTAFDRLNDDSRFDDSGKILPIEEGEAGTSAQPAKAENMEASVPSPEATPAPAPDKAATEDKSGQSGVVARPPEPGKPPAATTEESPEEASLRERLTRPEDKGPEWGIRAYRDLRKQYATVLPAIDAINSNDRVVRGLEFVAAFADTDRDVAESVEKLTALSSSRAAALRNHFYNEFMNHHADYVATDLVGEQATVQELQDGLKALRSGAKPGQDKPQPQSTTPTELQKPEGMTDDDWEDFKVDFPVAYKAMQTAHAALQQQAAAPAKADEPPVDPEKAQLQERVKQFEDSENRKALEAAVAEIDTKGRELYDQAYSVVKDGLRELGLEPAPGDDERTTKLKKDTAASIEQLVEGEFDGPDGPNGSEDFSLCSDEQKENRKLTMKVMKLLAEKDYAAANDYLPHLQASVDRAFQRVAGPKMDLYNAAMLQPTTSTRNAGQGHQRPEIIAGTAASGTNGASKTPWLDTDFRLPGESAFEAMNRYMDGQEAKLPGR